MAYNSSSGGERLEINGHYDMRVMQKILLFVFGFSCHVDEEKVIETFLL